MIKYSLVCSQGHEFEAWFQNSAAYDQQEARGLLACALCGSSEVRKAPMAPNVISSRGEKTPLKKMPQIQPEVIQAMREFRNRVLNEADYVGDQFPEEARKIHYNEVEPHRIYGNATSAEVRELLDEGIEVLPLPVLPEDHQ